MCSLLPSSQRQQTLLSGYLSQLVLYLMILITKSASYVELSTCEWWFCRRLNQIAPLESLRHVKRVKKERLEGGLYLMILDWFTYLNIEFEVQYELISNVCFRKISAVCDPVYGNWWWQRSFEVHAWCGIGACVNLPVECFRHKSGLAFGSSHIFFWIMFAF